jgi:hypothetical protein
MQGNVKDKLLHGNCFSKRIGAGKLRLNSRPRRDIRPSACMDCLLVGSRVERTSLATETGGGKTRGMAVSSPVLLSHMPSLN